MADRPDLLRAHAAASGDQHLAPASARRRAPAPLDTLPPGAADHHASSSASSAGARDAGAAQHHAHGGHHSHHQGGTSSAAAAASSLHLLSPSQRALDAAAPRPGLVGGGRHPRPGEAAPWPPLLVPYPPNGGLVGLINQGNTCYFNAALSALAHVPPLALPLTEAGGVLHAPVAAGAAGAQAEVDAALAARRRAVEARARLEGGNNGGSGSSDESGLPPVALPTPKEPVTLAGVAAGTLYSAWYGAYAAAAGADGGAQSVSSMAAFTGGGGGGGAPSSTAAAAAAAPASAAAVAPRPPFIALRPFDLLRQLRLANPVFDNWAQHDAAEAVRSLLGEIHAGTAVSLPLGLAAVPPPTMTTASAPTVGAMVTRKRPLSLGGVGESPSAPAGDDGADGASSTTAAAVRPWLSGGPYTGPDAVARSPVADCVQGLLSSRVHCAACGGVSVTYDAFLDLPLPIPRRQHPVARGGTGVSWPAAAAPAEAGAAGTGGKSAGKLARRRGSADSAASATSSSGAATPSSAVTVPTSATSKSPAAVVPPPQPPSIDEWIGRVSAFVGATDGGQTAALSAAAAAAATRSPAGPRGSSGHHGHHGHHHHVPLHAIYACAPPRPGVNAPPTPLPTMAAAASSGAAGSDKPSADALLAAASAQTAAAASASGVGSFGRVWGAMRGLFGSGSGSTNPASHHVQSQQAQLQGIVYSNAGGVTVGDAPSGGGSSWWPWGGSGSGSNIGSSAGAIGLGDCLLSFCDWEHLTGSDAYACESSACAGAKRPASKRLGLAALPDVLVLQLKRFSYAPSAWGGGSAYPAKNATPVAFPLTGLDVSPLLAVGGGGARGYPHHLHDRERATAVTQSPDEPLTGPPPVASAAHGAAVRLYVRAKEQVAGRRLRGHSFGGGGVHGDGAAAAPPSPALLAGGAPDAVSSSPDAAKHQPAPLALPPAASGPAPSPRTRRRAAGRDSDDDTEPGDDPAAAAADGGMADDDADTASTVTGSLPPSRRGSGSFAPGVLGGAASAGIAAAPSAGSSSSSSSSSSATAAVTGGSSGSVREYMAPDLRAWMLHRAVLATGWTGLEAVLHGGRSGGSGRPTSSPALTGAAPGGGATAAADASSLPASPLAVPPPASRCADPASLGPPVYDCVAVIQHIGSSLASGHYIAHVRHRPSGRWFTVDDASVVEISPADVARREAYVLFYARRAPTAAAAAAEGSADAADVTAAAPTATAAPRGKSKGASTPAPSPVPTTAATGSASASPPVAPPGSLLAALLSPPPPPAPLPAAHASQPPYALVSRSWWARYCGLAVPGPLSTGDILCDHGAVKRQLADRIKDFTVALTRPQYEALVAAYGAAEPPLTAPAACGACKAEAGALAARRAAERSAITKVDTVSISPSDACHIMAESWLAQWRAFIENTGPTDGTGRGTLPPGPIDNARLLGKGARPLPNQRPVIHYRGVAPPVWAFLHGIYGGGPPLPRRGIDLYGRPPVASAAVAAAPASAPAAVAQPQ